MYDPERRKGSNKKNKWEAERFLTTYIASANCYTILQGCLFEIWQMKCKVNNELCNTCNEMKVLSLACSFDFNS